jgi:hypothetical protein
LRKPSNCWVKDGFTTTFRDKAVCCADSSEDCCDVDPGPIVGILIAFLVFVLGELRHKIADGEGEPVQDRPLLQRTFCDAPAPVTIPPRFARRFC